jgi:hypothetical protein
MAVTDATNGQPGAASRCWCCGSPAEPDRMVHLGNHPEVGVCLRCAHFLSKRAQEIEDRSRTGAAVGARKLFRRLRQAVVAHGWQNSRFIGRPLRALGKHLP